VVDEDVNLPGVLVDEDVNLPVILVDEDVNLPGVLVDEDVNRPVQKMVDAKRGYETQDKSRSVFSEEKKLQDIPLKKV